MSHMKRKEKLKREKQQKTKNKMAVIIPDMI